MTKRIRIMVLAPKHWSETAKRKHAILAFNNDITREICEIPEEDKSLIVVSDSVVNQGYRYVLRILEGASPNILTCFMHSGDDSESKTVAAIKAACTRTTLCDRVAKEVPLVKGWFAMDTENYAFDMVVRLPD